MSNSRDPRQDSGRWEDESSFEESDDIPNIERLCQELADGESDEQQLIEELKEIVEPMDDDSIDFILDKLRCQSMSEIIPNRDQRRRLVKLLYTCESDFYRLLNKQVKTLTDISCHRAVDNFKFKQCAKLLMEQVEELDQPVKVYRGAKKDTKRKKDNHERVSRQFESCSLSSKVAESFIPEEGTFYVFNTRWIIDIGIDSAFPDEREVLIPPGTVGVVDKCKKIDENRYEVEITIKRAIKRKKRSEKTESTEQDDDSSWSTLSDIEDEDQTCHSRHYQPPPGQGGGSAAAAISSTSDATERPIRQPFEPRLTEEVPFYRRRSFWWKTAGAVGAVAAVGAGISVANEVRQERARSAEISAYLERRELRREQERQEWEDRMTDLHEQQHYGNRDGSGRIRVEPVDDSPSWVSIGFSIALVVAGVVIDASSK